MGIKVFNFLIAIGTIISVVALWLVVITYDPGRAGVGIFFLLYISGIMALGGVFLLISELAKRRFSSNQSVADRLGQSIRHAIFFSVLMASWVLLKSNGLLRWWNILLLVVMLTVLEFFFISFKRGAPIRHEG